MKNIFFFLTVLLVFSCTKENEEDYLSCDIDSVDYTSTIKNIIDLKCVNCHFDGNINGPVLENYEQVIGEIDNILLQINTNTMPPLGSPTLTECEKLQIQAWLDNGMIP